MSILRILKIGGLVIAGLFALLVVVAVATPTPPSTSPSPTPEATVSPSPSASETASPIPTVGSTDAGANTATPLASSPVGAGIAGETVLVTKVIDGDTIEIEDGKRVRYIGVDTPETVHPSKPVQCFGKEASAKNRELVEGKRVRLDKDVSETDKYGRLLRYVYVGDTFVNDFLVRQGYAHATSYPPDVKYQEQFRQAEGEARENKRGLWGGCPLAGAVPPAPPPPAQTQGQVGGSCTIKGNISENGEKIYHLPGCGSYDKTKIDVARGERWFCSEAEARAAGWRKARNCP